MDLPSGGLNFGHFDDGYTQCPDIDLGRMKNFARYTARVELIFKLFINKINVIESPFIIIIIIIIIIIKILSTLYLFPIK